MINQLGGFELHECPKCLRLDSIIFNGLCDSCIKDLQCQHVPSEYGNYCLMCGIKLSEFNYYTTGTTA